MLRWLCAICSSVYIFRVVHWLHGESTSMENFSNALFDSLWGFPGGTSDKDLSCQCRRHKRRGFNPSVGKIPWRKKWQPTPVFLPGVSHGQRSLAGYSPWGLKELDMTEWLMTCFPKDKWRKDGLFNKCVRKTGQPPAEEWNWTPVLCHSQKFTQNGLKT